MKYPRTRTAYVVLMASLLAFPPDSLLHEKRLKPRADYDRATSLRSALESHPEESRAKADYEKVIAAFRSVYRADPAYSKAPLAVEAEAEFYQEMGRQFSDPRAIHNSVTAYEFLVRQYPHSGLLASEHCWHSAKFIAPTSTSRPRRERPFANTWSLYPKSEKAADAREALKEIQSGSAEPVTGKDGSTDLAEVTARLGANSGCSSRRAPRPGQTLEVTSIRRLGGAELHADRHRRER